MQLGWHEQIGILEFHQGMIADRERVERYREAIHEIVEPGDVVVEVGTGTGLLAYFACQAGAARVYAIERGPVLRLAEEMRRANGFEDRVVFVPGKSTEVEVPERADVLLSEILWSFGLGEGIMGSILDARDRFLKPGGRMLPTSFDMLAAPAEAPKLYRRIAEAPADDFGLDFSVLRGYATSNMYPRPVAADALLAKPVTLQHFALDGDPPEEASGGGTAELTRGGTMHGVVGWFSSQLSPSVTLANPPGSVSSWTQVFFPLAEPLELSAGAEVGMRFQTSANGSVWRWTTEVDGKSTDATTFFGFPFNADGMKGDAPG